MSIVSTAERLVAVHIADVQCRAYHEVDDWYWRGIIPADSTAILAAAPCVGKSTLLRSLLAASGRGGEVLDRPVQQSRAIIVTEERPAAWLDAAGDYYLVRAPDTPITTPRAWRSWLVQVRALTVAHRADVVVLDSLTAVVGADLTQPRIARRVAADIHATMEDRTVVVLHHNTKASTGDIAGILGSTTLTAAFDSILLLSAPHGELDPRRRLDVYGRSPVEPHGIDYRRTAAGDLVRADRPKTARATLLRGGHRGA